MSVLDASDVQDRAWPSSFGFMSGNEQVNPRAATPAYVQLADILQARIERGELRPDYPIPSEKHLQQEFGLARGTVRRAIELLRERGVIITVQGRGSYVKPQEP